MATKKKSRKKASKRTVATKRKVTRKKKATKRKAIECKADQLGLNELFAVFEECERPVIVAATHSDAIVLFIECDQRCEHDLQAPRRQYLSINRFEQAELIPCQHALRC